MGLNFSWLEQVGRGFDRQEYDDDEQESSETKSDEFALKTIVFSVASRSKAKAKPRRSTSVCSSTRPVPISERSWTDIEPENFSSIAYPCQNN